MYIRGGSRPNQRGGRRGGRDLSGGAETISGVGAEGAYTISGGGRSYLRGGSQGRRTFDKLYSGPGGP